MKKALLICVPADEVPNYIERACKANGDTPEEYTKVPCPDCGRIVWLGPRGRRAVEADSVALTCAFCAFLVHGIRPGANLHMLTGKPQA